MTGHTEDLSCPQTKVEIRSLIKLQALGCSHQIHSYTGRGVVLRHLIARVPGTWHNCSLTNVPGSSKLSLVTLTCPQGCGIKAQVENQKFHPGVRRHSRNFDTSSWGQEWKTRQWGTWCPRELPENQRASSSNHPELWGHHPGPLSVTVISGFIHAFL